MSIWRERRLIRNNKCFLIFLCDKIGWNQKKNKKSVHDNVDRIEGSKEQSLLKAKKIH